MLCFGPCRTHVGCSTHRTDDISPHSTVIVFIATTHNCCCHCCHLCCLCQVCFAAIKDVLDKSGVAPREIGVVIVNCSLFNPTPSLSATIMNHFRMHSNVINYNLGGMGCSGARMMQWLVFSIQGHMALVLLLNALQ